MKHPFNIVSLPRIRIWSLQPWRWRTYVLTWTILSSNNHGSSNVRPPLGFVIPWRTVVLKSMYIHVYSINPYISCHKQNRMAALEERSALLFLFAEFLLSTASANHCENHLAFTLDILILRCASFVSAAFYASSCPSFCKPLHFIHVVMLPCHTSTAMDIVL